MINPPCPFLPEVRRVYTAADLDAFGKERGPEFYETALHYAQSLWQTGFPAKSLLLINRALSAPLGGDEPALARLPLPYRAVAWLLQQRPEGQFIGNPRRHYQHLATRMVPPNKALRTWRAWACWYLAKSILPEGDFPPDLVQIRNEPLIEPLFAQIRTQLNRLSPADDAARWLEALEWAASPELQRHSELPGGGSLRIRRIQPEETRVIQRLAHEIWPRCYDGIISQEQIRYMLSIWYQPDIMRHEILVRDVWFAVIEVEAAGPVGYLSFERLPDSDILFINKLYILAGHHGRGLGQLGLSWAGERARELGCRQLQLRVNKRNATAIRAYLRHGFQFIEDVYTDIGSGFAMDDYLMGKAVL